MKLLAPNGKPSNLTPEQYKLVRTPEFKAWFGDWEKAYETGNYDNVSKVIDEETKEPLVMYHGSPNYFTIFNAKAEAINRRGNFEGFYFTSNKDRAEGYSNVKLFKVFLKINKPLYQHIEEHLPSFNALNYIRNKYKNDFNKDYLEQKMFQLQRTGTTSFIDGEDKTKILIMDGYDGVFDGSFEYGDTVAFYPNQIKLADGTNTTFDANNPDIRYAGGGEILTAPNGKPSNLNPEQYKLVRTPEFKAWFGDWEKAYETGNYDNVSKVIDKETKEPLVVYHGSNFMEDIKVFKTISNLETEKPIFFSADRHETARYITDFDWIYSDLYYKNIPYYEKIELREKYYNSKIKPFFIKSNRIFDFNNLIEKDILKVIYFIEQNCDSLFDTIIKFLKNMGEPYDNWIEDKNISKNISKKYLIIWLLQNSSDDWWILETTIFQNYIKSNGYDSFTTKESGAWNIAVYNSSQSKLADGTNTTFDNNNPDIRYEGGGSLTDVIVSYANEQQVNELYELVSKSNELGSVGHPRLVLIQNNKVIGGIFVDNDYLPYEYMFDIFIKKSKRGKGYSKLLLDAMIKDFVENFPKADQIRGWVINKKLEDYLESKYDFWCADDNEEQIMYCYLSKKDAEKLLNEKYFMKGGEITEQDKKETYKKWKDLVNMSASELKKFMDSDEGKEAGLSKQEADKLGIHYGRESAKWILKMKDTPVSEWTPTMWRWAKRQISFNSRMRGNKGKLYDDKGRKTRKHLSLLIWGHNPEKYEMGGGVEETEYGTDYDTYTIANLGKCLKYSNQIIFKNQKDFDKKAGGTVFPIYNSKDKYLGEVLWGDYIKLVDEGKVIDIDTEGLVDDEYEEEVSKYFVRIVFLDEQYEMGGVTKLKEALKIQQEGSFKDKIEFVKENPEVFMGKFADGGELISERFKKWFGNSKVVDKKGNPLIVYHGSPDLRGLKEKYIFESRFLDNQSFFFTDNYKMAESYADPKGAFDYQNAEEGVIRLYLSLQNPLIVNALNQIWRKFETTIDGNKIIGTRNLIKIAKEKGYDGVIVQNVRDYYNQNEKKTKGGNVYVAFYPNQIKLADGTNTTFDGNNPDIRYKDGGDIPEGTKLLPLTMGKFAKDFDYLNQWKWRTGVDRSRDGKIVNYYGQRTIFLGGKTPNTKAKTKLGSRYQQVITLGKQIMGIPEDRKLRVDYIDGNKLNNQKSNLRIATINQINYGATSPKDKKKITSKYIGVYHRFIAEKKIYDKRTNSYYIRNAKSYWRVVIKDRERKYYKNFPYTDVGEIKAAKWYDSIAKLIHGEFAVLNFPEDKYENGGNIQDLEIKEKDIKVGLKIIGKIGFYIYKITKIFPDKKQVYIKSDVRNNYGGTTTQLRNFNEIFENFYKHKIDENGKTIGVDYKTKKWKDNFEQGGELNLTSEQVENKLGRKLHWWNDNVVSINGIEYKKVFLKNEYRRL